MAHHEMGKPLPEAAEKLAQLSGWPITPQHILAIDGEDLQQIHNQHGEGHEKPDGQLPIPKTDATQRINVLHNHAAVKFGMHPVHGPALTFRKELADGNIAAVVVNRGKRVVLHIKTMHKYPT
ncbi:MAG TPA: hypothetical protein VFE24_09260 [Pirellulales bacterium]|jgi:hypothetical protein|nr:hypothetical protein [Pirellulales bacterium]